MIEIRQTQDELPGNRLPDSSGHTSGLLCRKHAQQFMRVPSKVHTAGLDERRGRLCASEELSLLRPISGSLHNTART